MIFQECNCNYCKKHGGFPVFWNLRPKGSLVDILWFEIPKNGSASIKRAWPKKVHINYKDVLDIFLPPIRKFWPWNKLQVNHTTYVVLRDPIDRFISLFKHYFSRAGIRYNLGDDFGKKLGVDIKEMDQKTRFNFVINNLGELSTDEEVHHFYPQSYFIDTNIKYTNINFINLRELSSSYLLSFIPKSNRHLSDATHHLIGSPRQNLEKIQLNKKQRVTLKNIYEDDYKLFNDFNFKPTKE